MMFKICFYILSVLFILTSCKKFSPENNLKVRITVPLLRSDHQIMLSSISDSLQYIKLETTDECLIGGIDKIYSVGDKLIILDGRITNSIFFYNQYGAFINKINKKGRGPGEYIAISDIAINDKDEEIIIWDIRSRKLLFYSFGGDFLYDIEFPYFGRSIEYICDGLLAVYCDYSLNRNLFVRNTSPNLILFNIKTRKEKYDIYFDSTIKTDAVIINLNYFSSFRDQVLLFPNLSNSVYGISNDGIEEKYYLDFGIPFKQRMDTYIKNLPDLTVSNALTAQQKSNLPFVLNILSSNEIIFFFYTYNRSVFYNGFYYPVSNTYIEASSIKKENSPIVLVKNDIDNTIPFWPISASKENIFYCVIESFNFINFAKNSENEKIRDLSRNTDSQDNPIIMKSFMKTL